MSFEQDIPLKYVTKDHGSSRIGKPKFVNFVGIPEQHVLGDSDRLRPSDIPTTISISYDLYAFASKNILLLSDDDVRRPELFELEAFQDSTIRANNAHQLNGV